MNDFVNEYLNKKADEVLGPNPDALKKQELLDKFQTLILDLVVDNLNDEQVLILQALEPNSPEMETKLEQFAATIPDLSKKIENMLNEEFEKLKSNPQ